MSPLEHFVMSSDGSRFAVLPYHRSREPPIESTDYVFKAIMTEPSHYNIFFGLLE